MRTFRDLIIFNPGTAGIFTMGGDAVRLTAAIKAVPGAREAAVALGDPFNRARRERALAILEALPARQQEKILSAYRKAKRDEVAA
ncbi:hypothetical protein VQ02_19810 [Methylobacterium variabile]|uniref:Uncharacterized protein n=1 Tax=Methylobacterium variabile TaxID=298794 RepID=A0A0J6SJS6_9HYPH|nr:hypothetical protein [Methylobacterium variabile]KMO33894.1 hypothetical protein VQ02_19810 [Methylobacterium variabile]